MNADGEADPQIGAVRTPKLVQRMLTTEQILGNVETAVIVVDHDGCLRYANSFAADLFGFPGPRHLTDVPFRRLGFHEEDVSKVENLEYQACRGRDWEGTLAIRRPDGSNFFVRMTASPMRDPAGEVTGTVIMARQAVQVGTERSAGRTGLLDRIGERLGSSLELDDTLQRVAETLVPQFAYHCFIDLRTKEVLVRSLQKNAWGVMIEDVTDKDHSPPAGASLESSRNAGMTSVIAAPLVMRGKELGVLTLALSDLLTDRDTRHYVADDRDLVAAIASRVSVAIDNALLFEEERATALAFQTSLLPSRPPVLDGLEVAYRYVPAKPPLSAGRIGIVIGDVEGRGARAAAIMGQLRSALRAFAQDDKAPADILRRLDDWCRWMTDEREESGIDPFTASCTYLIYDPWSRRLALANAGHMPPLIVTDQDVIPMEIEHQGVLIGVRGLFPGLPTYREESRKLEAGSTLIFYTDGLVDRRHRADGPGHYGDLEVFSMLSDAVNRARPDRRRHGDPGDQDVARGPEDLGHALPRRPDQGLRGEEGSLRNLRRVRHGRRAGRTGLPAGVRGRHQRGPAHGPGPHASTRLRVRGGRQVGGIEGHRGLAGLALRRGPLRRERVRGRVAEPGVHAADPQGPVLGVGRGVRLRPAAAENQERRRERRGRSRPVPGRPARDPVGLAADGRGQGGLVRDADQGADSGHVIGAE